jgi:hypothetical protein
MVLPNGPRCDSSAPTTETLTGKLPPSTSGEIEESRIGEAQDSGQKDCAGPTPELTDSLGQDLDQRFHAHVIVIGVTKLLGARLHSVQLQKLRSRIEDPVRLDSMRD